MFKNSPYKSYTRSILSYFGLYKYENAEPRKVVKSYHHKFVGAYIATAMFVLMLLSVCMFFIRPGYSEVSDKVIKLPGELRNDSILTGNDDHPVTVISLPSRYLVKEHRGIVDGKSTTSTTRPPLRPPKTLRKLMTSTSHMNKMDVLGKYGAFPWKNEVSLKQKRVRFLPRPNYLDTFNGITVAGIRDQIPRPPRLQKILIMRKYDSEEPRPFNYHLEGLQPSEFKKKNVSMILPNIPKDYAGDVNNIQDILRQVRGPEIYREAFTPFTTSSGLSGIQFSGRYRHPKNMGIKKIFDPMVSNSNNQDTKLSGPNYMDPLNSFKPHSPSDVNLLALNQYGKKPRFVHGQTGPSLVPEAYHPNMENMYPKLITTNNNRQKLEANSRKSFEGKKQRPFSLMLDVYPMPEDDHFHAPSTQRPIRTSKPRKPYFPLPPGPNAVNNLPYPYQLENSYYNSINFPQLQQNKYVHATTPFHNPFFQSGSSGPENIFQRGRHEGENKPSQIMVHLNLFPKKKVRQYEQNDGYDSNKRVFDNHADNANMTGGMWNRPRTTNNRMPKRNQTEQERLDKPVVVIEEEIVTRDDNANRGRGVTLKYPELVNPNINPRGTDRHSEGDLIPEDSVIVTQTFIPPTRFIDDFQIPEHEIIKFQLDDALYPGTNRFSLPGYK